MLIANLILSLSFFTTNLYFIINNRMYWIRSFPIIVLSARVWGAGIDPSLALTTKSDEALEPYSYNITAGLSLFRRILDYFGYDSCNNDEDEEEAQGYDTEDDFDRKSYIVRERYLYDDTDTDSDCQSESDTDDDNCTDSDSDAEEFHYYFVKKQQEPPVTKDISFIGRKELVLGRSDQEPGSNNTATNSAVKTQLLLGGMFCLLPLVREIRKLGHETVMSPAFASVAGYFNERARVGALKVSQSFQKADWRSLYKFITQPNSNLTIQRYDISVPPAGMLQRAKKILKQKIIRRARLLESRHLMPAVVASALQRLDADGVVHTLQIAANVTLPMVNATSVRARNRHLLNINHVLGLWSNGSRNVTNHSVSLTTKESNFTSTPGLSSKGSYYVRPIWSVILVALVM